MDFKLFLPSLSSCLLSCRDGYFRPFMTIKYFMWLCFAHRSDIAAHVSQTKQKALGETRAGASLVASSLCTVSPILIIVCLAFFMAPGLVIYCRFCVSPWRKFSLSDQVWRANRFTRHSLFTTYLSELIALTAYYTILGN